MAQENTPLEGVFIFELADRTGKMHEYESTMFGLDGIDMAIEIRSMAAEPIARAVGSVGTLRTIYELFQEGGFDASLDWGVLFESVIKADVPWSEVVNDIKAAFSEAGNGKLVRKILARTYRDGKPLGDDRNFGKSYGRNWNEMIVATYKVAEWNDFMGFTLTSTDASGAAGAAVAALLASASSSSA